MAPAAAAVLGREAVRIARCSRSRPCPHCILGCSQEGDGCDYLIVLQQGEDVAPPGPLPTLPENARFVQHANECYDWGTWGWALHSHVPDLSAYQYFIFLNPSVRTLSRCTHRLLRSVCPGHQPKTHPRLMPPAAAVALHQAWCLCATLCCRRPGLTLQVRGPFLPAYLRGRMHWTEPLLSKLSDSVKLVSTPQPG